MINDEEKAFRQEQGLRLAAARHATGISLTAVAAAIGVTKQRISYLEHGEALYSAWDLARYAAAIGVHPSTLIASIDDVGAGVVA
jgi:transcriptional regulator with XRE-family HTH domain